MAKRNFATKRGLKRHSRSESVIKREKEQKKKNRSNRAEMFNDRLSPTASDGLSEDHSDGASEEEVEEKEEVVAYKELTMYDNLLNSLSSGSKSVAHALERRQRGEEGKSDSDEGDYSEEDMDGGSESLSESEEQDDGRNDEGFGISDVEDSPEGSGLAVHLEQTDYIGTVEGGCDVSDTDDDVDFQVTDQSIAETSPQTSTFDNHLNYKLSREDIDNLLRKKWNYKWEVPAVDMSNCKWRGTGENFLKESEINPGYGLKPQLYRNWLEKFKESGASDFHSSRQRFFFSICNSYRDILHHNKNPFYLKGREEDSSTMDAYIMHSLNHILKTGHLVKKNASKMTKLQESTKGEDFINENILDQGFTRPKVLILLPLASIALRVVERLIEMTPKKHKVNVENRDRFLGEFRIEKSEDEEAIQKSESKKSSKPSDFQALFGGNNNDHFMIGVKFTRSTIRLYSDFYSSDMIVASPLGLITKIGEAEVEKEKDVDYLSSIEVLIVDHADIIVMQNWSHVNTIAEKLNQIPSKQHGTDIMRIRQWYLDGQARFYRQTIILSSHTNPDINAFFNHHCLNHEGKIKLACHYRGVLPKILLQVQQIYQRFDVESIECADDARLEYFSKKVFPKIKDSIQGGTMIFISSYFEFVRLRNFLKSQEASFCLLSEYTKQKDVSRARVWFFQGQRKTMLYTERSHFYHRYKIRGIQNLIVYSLPERKEFYPEIVNMLETSENATCTVLFSRFDQLRLERIVGSGPAKRLVTSDKGVFVFC